MEKLGFVIGVTDTMAQVNVIRPSECGDKCTDGCKGGCEIKTLNVKVTNTLNASVGDQVALALAPQQFVKLTFLLYTLPLMAFVAGVVIGYAQYDVFGFNQPDIPALLGGFGLMIVTYLVLNRVIHRGGNADVLTMTQVYRKDNRIE